MAVRNAARFGQFFYPRRCGLGTLFHLQALVLGSQLAGLRLGAVQRREQPRDSYCSRTRYIALATTASSSTNSSESRHGLRALGHAHHRAARARLAATSAALGLMRPRARKRMGAGAANGARRSYTSLECWAMNCLTMRSSSE